MDLKYAIFPNPLSDDPEDQRAMIQDQQTLTEEDLLKQMYVPGGVTSTQAKAVLTSFREILKRKLAEGYAVTTDLNRYSLSVGGPFKGRDSKFNKKDNYIRLNVSPRNQLKSVTDLIQVKKVDGYIPKPTINSVINCLRDNEDNSLTVGRIAEIEGKLLKFDPEDERQGVFLKLEGKPEIRCSHTITNQPSKILFYIPDEIPAEEVSLCIRTCLRNQTKIRTEYYPEKIKIYQE